MVKKYEKMIPPSNMEEMIACKGPLECKCESNMRKYIKELVDAGLIERKQVPNRKANGKFVTRNYFTILWFKRMLELKKVKNKKNRLT